MSSEIAIEVRGVKLSFPRVRYRARGIKEGFLSLVRRTPKLEHERKFWALQGIDLTVARGEVLGLVGRNGSGKSTLLRVICGIYTPDEGNVYTKGRISSLLELGAGFRDELNGYENIRLSGAILGLSKTEIAKLTPEITEFAGLGEFMEQPLKTYSSGMRARLGFSVASSVNPDILLIDEALAVGDAAFREKSMAKVTELVRRDDTTVVLVSHSAADLRQLSTRMALLSGGKLITEGSVNDVMAEYERRLAKSSAARG